MLAHYSHVRIDATRKALDALATVRDKIAERGAEGGYDTNSDTKSAEARKRDSEVIESWWT